MWDWIDAGQRPNRGGRSCVRKKPYSWVESNNNVVQEAKSRLVLVLVNSMELAQETFY